MGLNCMSLSLLITMYSVNAVVLLLLPYFRPTVQLEGGIEQVSKAMENAGKFSSLIQN